MDKERKCTVGAKTTDEGNGFFMFPRLSIAGFTSKYNNKTRGALKDLELQADLVHETKKWFLMWETVGSHTNLELSMWLINGLFVTKGQRV